MYRLDSELTATKLSCSIENADKNERRDSIDCHRGDNRPHPYCSCISNSSSIRCRSLCRRRSTWQVNDPERQALVTAAVQPARKRSTVGLGLSSQRNGHDVRRLIRSFRSVRSVVFLRLSISLNGYQTSDDHRTNKFADWSVREL